MNLALLILSRLWRFSRRATLWTLPVLVVLMAGCTAADTDTARELTIAKDRLDNARADSRRMYEAWHDTMRRLAHVCPEQFSGPATASAPTTNQRLPPLAPDDLLRYNRCAEAARLSWPQ